MGAPEAGGASLVVGVDTGGTFTDLWAVDEGGGAFAHKVLSTPADPAAAVLTGLRELLAMVGGEGRPVALVHGSTVATNALLERRGARTALVTTEGFRDVLAIGRQTRRDLYDLTPAAPEPLIPRTWCFEAPERVGADGVVRELTAAAARAVADAVAQSGVESVAICLLFSFRHPEHEARLAEEMAARGLFVSASHAVLPEHREYERAAATAINAYVSPLMARYLGNLERHAASCGVTSFRVMQSNGGSLGARQAGELGVHTILSGPAGGAVGALRAGRSAGLERIIGFDMGGTSTDVSLLPGRLSITTEAAIDGWPIRVPVLDIHTVGAGGGSIAYVDAGGALRVGPRSAGADPGPACYGRGGREATVTDANVVLGRLGIRHFLGGRLPLDRAAAEGALAELGQAMRCSPAEAASGVIQVVNANMERALRVISVERGHDPADFTLVSFGGAGGLHACELAQSLGIRRVLIPPDPGVFSARGMALADVVKTYSRGILRALDEEAVELASQVLAELAARASGELGESPGGAPPGADLRLEAALDLRYAGQSFELTIPVQPRRPAGSAGSPDGARGDLPAVAWGERDALIGAFHQAHEAAFGYAFSDERIELVTVRLRASAPGPLDVSGAAPHAGGRRPAPPEMGRERPDARSAAAPTYFAAAWIETPVYVRSQLTAGSSLDGPAIIAEDHATTLLPPGARLTAHPGGALLITVG